MESMDERKALLNLAGRDLSEFRVIRTAKNVKKANLSWARGFHGTVDFRFCNVLRAAHVNLKEAVSVIVNPYAEEIDFSYTKGLFGIWRCGQMKKVIWQHTDMSNISMFQGAKETDLHSAVGLCGFYDFLESYYVDLSDTDVSNAKMRFNPNGKKVNMTNVKGLSGVLYFGNTEHVILFGADLTKVTKIIVGPNTDLSLAGAKGFSGEIEYLTSKKLSQQVAGTKHIYRNQAKRQVRTFYRAAISIRGGR